MHFPAPLRARRPALPTTRPATPSTSGSPDQNAGRVSRNAGIDRPRAVPPALSLRRARGTTSPKMPAVTTPMIAPLTAISGQSWANSDIRIVATTPLPTPRAIAPDVVGVEVERVVMVVMAGPFGVVVENTPKSWPHR